MTLTETLIAEAAREKSFVTRSAVVSTEYPDGSSKDSLEAA
jgi:hypothetical protein